MSSLMPRRAGQAYGRRMGPPPVVRSSFHATLRSHFGREGRAGRAARALTTAVSALALAVGALTLVPTPALADDAVPSQDYFSYYPLDTVRAKGYTGKGVTIAAIGGPVDTSDPALKGAKVTDKSRCTVEATPRGNVMAPTWRSSWFPPRPAWHQTRPCTPTSRLRHRQRRTARAAPMGGGSTLLPASLTRPLRTVLRSFPSRKVSRRRALS